MIEFKHLSKRFSSASGMIDALQDVNLSIADGDIFGVIGIQRRREIDAPAHGEPLGGSHRGGSSHQWRQYLGAKP